MSSVKSNRPFWVYDRREGKFFILISDSGEIMHLPALPSGASPGDVFVIEDGLPLPRPKETAARRKRIKDEMDRIFGGK